MKKVIITVGVLLALGATWGMAQQPLQKEGQSGMQSMMKDMMQESKPDNGSRGMMQGMDGMMGMMMKMMDQCSDMMKSAQQERENVSETEIK